jgi:hypothetical protein
MEQHEELVIQSGKLVSVSFKEEAKNYLKNWLKRTTSHGLSRVVTSKYLIIKCLWVLLYLTSFTYMLYLCIDIIRQYSAYRTTISQTIVRESRSQFPAVTICNYNAFDERYISYVVNKYNLLAYADGQFDCILNTKANFSKWNLEKCDFTANEFYSEFPLYLLVLLPHINITYNDLVKLGNTLEKNMLISCTYNGEECNETWFYTYWRPNVGFCHVFNYFNHQNVLSTGYVGNNVGLKLTLQTSNYISLSLFSFG